MSSPFIPLCAEVMSVTPALTPLPWYPSHLSLPSTSESTYCTLVTIHRSAPASQWHHALHLRHYPQSLLYFILSGDSFYFGSQINRDFLQLNEEKEPASDPARNNVPWPVMMYSAPVLFSWCPNFANQHWMLAPSGFNSKQFRIGGWNFTCRFKRFGNRGATSDLEVGKPSLFHNTNFC